MFEDRKRNPRKETVTIRFTRSEYRWLKQESKKRHGGVVPEFIRHVLADEVVRREKDDVG